MSPCDVAVNQPSTADQFLCSWKRQPEDVREARHGLSAGDGRPARAARVDVYVWLFVPRPF